MRRFPTSVGSVAVVAAFGMVLTGSAGQPMATTSGSAAVTGDPVRATSICDSDGDAQGARHRIVMRERDSGGVRVTFIVLGAKPGSHWGYEVSVTTKSSGETVRVGEERANAHGRWSFSMFDDDSGQHYADSGLGPRSGNQYCSMGLTATFQ